MERVQRSETWIVFQHYENKGKLQPGNGHEASNDEPLIKWRTKVLERVWNSRRFETGLVITSGTLLSSPFISSPLKSDSYVIQRKDVKSTSCLSRSLPLLSYIPKNRRWKQMEITRNVYPAVRLPFLSWTSRNLVFFIFWAKNCMSRLFFHSSPNLSLSSTLVLHFINGSSLEASCPFPGCNFHLISCILHFLAGEYLSFLWTSSEVQSVPSWKDSSKDELRND